MGLVIVTESCFAASYSLAFDTKHAISSEMMKSQAAQALFVIYIRDSIALRFEPFKRMYETVRKLL